MKHSNAIIIALATLIVGMLFNSFYRKSFIDAREITGGKLVVYGMLGSPIGTLVKLKCIQIAENRAELLNKEILGFVKIVEVNGTKLKSTVLYPRRQIVMIEGVQEGMLPDIDEAFECYAFEKLCYHGNPFEMIEGTIVQGQPPCFATLLYVTRIEPKIKPHGLNTQTTQNPREKFE